MPARRQPLFAGGPYLCRGHDDPRHAGFYIWAYASAYVQTRDPKFSNRIEVLIESRTGRRLQPFSLLVDAGQFQPETSLDPAMRQRAEEVADRFVVEGIPPVKDDLWPCATGQVISLLVTLHCALTNEPHQPGHNDVNW